MNRYIFFFLHKYWKIYVSLCGVTILAAVFEGFNISLLIPLLTSAFHQEVSDRTVFIFLNKIIGFMPFKDFFINACLLSILLMLLKSFFTFGRQALQWYGVGKITADTKEAVLQKYINSEYSFFLERKQGDLSYWAVQAPGTLGTCLRLLPDILVSIFMTIILGVLLFSISFSVSLFLAIGGFALSFITRFLARKVSYHLGRERVSVTLKSQVILNEFLDGIKHIKLAETSSFWKEKFSEAVRRFKTIVIQDALWLEIPENLAQLVPTLIIIGGAIYLYSIAHFSTDVLLKNFVIISVYAFAFYRLLPRMTSIGKLHMQLAGTLADVEGLYHLLNVNANPMENGFSVVQKFQREIKFEHVFFGYKKEHFVLSDISLTFPKEKVTVITGPSGSGKSTLVNLLMKLFPVSQGRILIDGIDIRDISLSSLTKLIALVSQETFIFNGTIKDNILFGLTGMNEEEIVSAARLAYAHEFIGSLEKGYETLVGDKGLKLSGGQRQRIAIARAFLRNPQVIILDEASSSLDAASEMKVQEALDQLSHRRTVIAISHRLSVSRHADKIIVLDQGRVVEEGHHHGLMGKNGVYKNLMSMQSLYA